MSRSLSQYCRVARFISYVEVLGVFWECYGYGLSCHPGGGKGWVFVAVGYLEECQRLRWEYGLVVI